MVLGNLVRAPVRCALLSLILHVALVASETDLGSEHQSRQLRWGKLKARKRPVLGSFDDPYDGVQPPIGPQPRIIGGAAVDPNEDRYPYFSLLLGGQGKKCGGVLITPSIVVTAAHCEIAADTATVGVQSRDSDWIGNYEDIPVAQRVPHPDYGSSGYDHDIMVIKLDFPSAKPPIRLNADPNLPEAERDTKMWTMGFGATDASTRQGNPTELQVIDVEYVPQNTCGASFRTIDISDDMLCATADEKGVCSGDSGGPMIIKDGSTENDILVGVVAWGIGCANSRYPNVYSRISYFYDWIVDQVCELSSEDAPEYMGCPTSSPTQSVAPSVSTFPSLAPSISPVPSFAPTVSPRP